MKKNLIKKVFAVSLSIAMACSFLPAANPVTASAAAPFVSLKTNFKTLKVNQSYTMKLKNNTINWKIKKVETTDKTIATVYGKTTSQVMIKGKSEGRATVRVYLKTSSRKANNTKTLRCRVKVVPDTTSQNPTTPVQTDAEVKTQADLDAALNNSNITKITINPTTEEKFEIKENTYASVDLIVDAPLADIDNSATFKSITINNIKPQTWTERGKGNAFTILAKAAKLIVDKTASVRNITVGTTDANVTLDVNGGTVLGVNVNAKSTVSITGTAADSALIPVIFGAAAADATFTTELPVAVTMSASVNLTFEKGAVKSTIKLQVAGIKLNLTNRTSESIKVTKNDDTVTYAPIGVSTVNAVSGSTTPVTPGTSTTYPGSVSKPATSASVVTGGSISVSGTVTPGAITVGTETQTIVTESSITVTISDIIAKTTSSSDVVEYTITARGTNWNKEVYKGTLSRKSGDAGLVYDENDKVKAVNYADAKATFDINKVAYGDVTFVVSLKVKETAAYAASSAVTVKSAPINMSNLNADIDQW